MCAVVMAALVINLSCSLFAVLHLRSGGLYSSSNCHRSYRSSLDGMDAVIGRGGRSNQCCHYYQDSRAPDRGSRRGQRGAGTGSSLRSLLRLHTASDLGEHRQLLSPSRPGEATPTHSTGASPAGLSGTQECPTVFANALQMT